MIELKEITKTFGNTCAVNHVTLQVMNGSIMGLLGVNGAGKSTLLRMIAGVLHPDSGQITIDGEVIAENEACRQKLFYLSDQPYFFTNATIRTMAEFYANLYPDFAKERFFQMCEEFGFDDVKKIRTFSKGMKKQTAVLLALCSGADYILCDELFDGLDPLMRKKIQELFLEEVKLRKITLIAATHTLNELEGFCDCVGILHGKGITLAKDVEQAKHDAYRILA